MKINKEDFTSSGECKLGDYTIHYFGFDIKPIELRREGETALLFAIGDEDEIRGVFTVKDNDEALYINKLYCIYYTINDKVVNVIFQERGY